MDDKDQSKDFCIQIWQRDLGELVRLYFDTKTPEMIDALRPIWKDAHCVEFCRQQSQQMEISRRKVLSERVATRKREENSRRRAKRHGQRNGRS